VSRRLWPTGDRLGVIAALLGIVGAACGSSTNRENPLGRFSWAINDPVHQASTLQALDLWTSSHADAAILHISVPYAALLAGFTAQQVVDSNERGLANYYRAKGLRVVITVDATNGLDRSQEDPTLVALGRSITDTAIQRLYREFVLALDTIVHPDYLGLAAETNLIRAAAPDSVYLALVAMTNATAAQLAGLGPGPNLFVSVQVEVAWGRLLPGGGYVGIAQDLTDFPFGEALGLSSYYLGFDPEPTAHYARIRAESALPVLVVEGGGPRFRSERSSSPADRRATSDTSRGCSTRRAPSRFSSRSPISISRRSRCRRGPSSRCSPISAWWTRPSGQAGARGLGQRAGRTARAVSGAGEACRIATPRPS
jgi:hypothetical protein